MVNQVELPQLSFQRYLELVKRRRWQLVPVSLLGLLVGGVVAFFIPRYFVATTLVEHQKIAGKALDRGDDPFQSIVRTAKETIPLAAGDAMRRLRWPEAMVSDPYQQAQNERAVRSELRVTDVNPDRERDYAQLRVTYRDRDGLRAAAFLNTLIETWVEQRANALRKTAEEASRQADLEQRQLGTQIDNLQREKIDIEQRYRIEPDATPELQRKQFQDREDERKKTREELRQKKVELRNGNASLATDKERLLVLPARVPPNMLDLLAAAEKSPKVAIQLILLQRRQKELETFLPGTPAWAAAKRGEAQARRELQKALNPRSLEGEISGEDDGLVPNPERVLLQETIVATEKALLALAEEVAELEGDVAEQDRRIGDAATGLPEWTTKKNLLAELWDARGKARQRMRDADEIIAQLGRAPPILVKEKANTPPRPTEPNILVVALIGCVLGLGAAIAIILLLDFLQGTFKTVDDVERGLPVPVLGGMSHLVTDDERRAVQRGRRRASLAAFGFVGLVVVVVTIFYVDPTRLPPVVYNLLAMLLGT